MASACCAVNDVWRSHQTASAQKKMAELIEIERERTIHMVSAIRSYDDLLKIYVALVRALAEEMKHRTLESRPRNKPTKKKKGSDVMERPEQLPTEPGSKPRPDHELPKTPDTPDRPERPGNPAHPIVEPPKAEPKRK